MKKGYLVLSWSVLTLTTLVVYFLLNINLSSVNANPDYICKKSVTDSPCEIETCWPWGADHKRTCYWKKVTEVSYYHIRTSCEPWYMTGVTWSTNKKDTAAKYAHKDSLYDGYDKWASWRNSSDYVSATESCEVIQYDTIPPTWEIK